MIYSKLLLFLINNPCEEPEILRVIYFIRRILEVVFVAVPIVLIVLIVFDFIKNVLVGNEDTMKKNQKLVIKRIVFAVFLFFVFPIVNLVFGIFNTSNQSELVSSNGVNYLSCWNNSSEIKYINSKEKIVHFITDKNKKEIIKKCDSKDSFHCEITDIPSNITKDGYTFTGWDYSSKCNSPEKIDKITLSKDLIKLYACFDKNDSNNVDNNNDNSNSNQDNEDDKNNNSDGFIGTKYQLTETELNDLAYLCYKEQGNAVGAAYEAALMANRFELYGEKKGYDTLYDYVKNLGWWSNSKEYMNGKNKASKDIVNAVSDVLINGNRPMPKYIDEHDCISCGSLGYDIIKLKIGDKVITDKNELLNKKNYIKDKTIIYNRYEAVYTFYTFPTEKSDPFGYTSRAKKSVEP